ncbi:MAG: hypothetical protein B7Y99_05280 [Caulobacterales bacterium 32-69-10]|nr:MAG: hypothetical protein B7Y99_05280 [Caulobacterales bacterium 32-69-10]
MSRPVSVPVCVLALGVLALGGLAVEGLFSHALAQTAAPAYPPYPAVRNVETIRQWVGAQTDIAPGTVVGIGQDSVFSVEPGRDRLAAAPAIRVSIRQEAIDPDFTRRLNGRSAVMTVDLDCSNRKVFQRALALYAGSNRQGAVRQLGAGTAWRDVPRGSYMDAVVNAVCDPGWRPLYPANPRLAANAPPRATAAPILAPTAPASPVRSEASTSATAFSRAEYGRFGSATAALQAAQALDLAFPDAMAGKPRRIELLTAGGRTEFRGLVEGFASPAEVETFCRRLQTAGRTCSGAS